MSEPKQPSPSPRKAGKKPSPEAPSAAVTRSAGRSAAATSPDSSTKGTPGGKPRPATTQRKSAARGRELGETISARPEGPGLEVLPPLSGGVYWHRLTLYGFGPFPGRVDLDLASGLGVLVAPNEAGKTSVVHGLAAVLFGLHGEPAAAGDIGFSVARFRHWRGAPRFEGELEFTALDGQRYQLLRSFDNHQVRLLRLTPEGAIPEWSGTHNPGAQTRTSAFETRLQGLIGLRDRTVFVTTFCVEQPLPVTAAIDHDVQKLLSGPGESSYGGALRELEQALSKLTATTGCRGVTEEDASAPGLLEQLQQTRKELEERLERDQVAVDELQQVSTDLMALQTRHRTLGEQLRDTSSALEVFSGWEQSTLDYRRQQRRLHELQRTLELAQERYHAWETATQTLELWPEFADETREFGQELDRVVDLVRVLDDCEQRRRRLLASLEVIAREQQQGAKALEHDYPDLMRDGRLATELAADLRELRSRSNQLEQLRSRVAELDAQVAKAREDVEATEATDTNALALRSCPEAIVVQVASGYRDLVRTFRRHQELTRQRAEVRAAASGYEALSESGFEFATLQAEAMASQTDVSVQRAVDSTQARAINDELERLEQSYKDVARLDDGLLPIMESKVTQLEACKRAEWQLEKARNHRLERERQRILATLKAMVTGLVIGAALFYALRGQAYAEAALLVPLLLAVGTWLAAGTPSRSEEEALEKEEQALAMQLQRLDATLGNYARESVFELSRLRVKRLEYLARREEIQTRQRVQTQVVMAGAPAGQDPRIRQLLLRYASPLAAVEAWNASRQQALFLEQEHVRLCQEVFQCTPEDMPGRSAHLAGPVWEQASQFAKAFGVGPNLTLEELVEWMERRPSAFWTSVVAQDTERRQSGVRREFLTAQLQSAEQAQSRERAELAAVEEAVERLRLRTAPFDEHSDAEVIYELLREAAAVVDHMRALETQRALLESQLRDEDTEASRLGEALRPLQAALDDVLKAADLHGESPRMRWHKYTEARAHWLIASEALEGVLQAAQAEDVHELAVRVVEAEREVAGLVAEIAALSGRSSLLPSLEGAADQASHDLERRHLEERLEALQVEFKACEDEQTRLALQQARLQGREVSNLCEMEEQLASVTQRLHRLAREADVLTLAWHELRDAVGTYHHAHRARLQEAATESFACLTGTRGRTVVFDERLHVGLREADGLDVAPEQLSQGTQDQLYLAVRLAIADLMSGRIALPFVFDDPFLNADAQRMRAIGETLKRLAQGRQVILLTHREELQVWGTRLQMRS